MIAANTLEPSLVLEIAELSHEPESVTTSKTHKPRVWTAFATWILASSVGMLAAIAGYFVVGFAIGIAVGASGTDSAAIQTRVQDWMSQPLPALLLSLLPFQFGMAMVVLLAARRSKTPLEERLGLLPQTGRAFGAFKLATMAAFTLSTALTAFIVSSLLLGPAPANDPVAAAINNGSWLTITVLSIILSVIPALVEETLFRGYMQRRFLERWSPAVAIGVTSLLFAIMHMDSLQHIIAVIPLAVVTGLLAYRTNSVKPGMVVHAVHNTGAVAFSAVTTTLMPLIDTESLGLLVIGTIVAMGLIGLPAIVSLSRNAKPRPLEAIVAEPELAVVSLSVLSRERIVPDHTIDSRLAG